ncbi:MAG: lasso RiPP family leader peptide-containing protein [Candidatus Promineifilaceae bacterium]
MKHNQMLQKKSPYVKPQLIRYGNIRDITLGPSLGVGDSGMGDLSMKGFSNAVAQK